MKKTIITLYLLLSISILFASGSSIIIKFKNNENPPVKPTEARVNGELKPVFAYHYNQLQKGKPTRLSGIFSVTVSNKEQQAALLSMLKKDTAIEYAEIKPTVKLFDVPDDPATGSQYYLSQVNAYDAWDISQGDSTIVIGIVDTGTDFTHDDLSGKCAINYNDPINGIDDDMDGFIDNYHGWDLSENNNNPQADINGHGVRVAGIAAAATNNGTGIAGVGYNVRYLPVKTMNSLGELNTAYEGIVYAADHGADVIVCSWGGIIESEFGRDIVQYAVYEKNAVVVAAAGNSSNEDVYFPASYPEVLAVAATNANDQKWTGSTFGYQIDISAPGEGIYATTLGNGYGNGWGTSFAAPMAGAVAGLIKHQRPHLTAMQIVTQIKNTTYFLDTIPQNVYYEDKLGSGRLDAFSALTDTSISGIELQNISVDGGHRPGDTLFIQGEIINYLMNAAVLIEVESLSEYAEIINSSLNAGILGTFDTYSFENNSLSLRLSQETPYNETITLKINISDGSKTYRRFITFNTNKSYIDLTENDLNSTITSNGRIGHNQTSAPLQGRGIWMENNANMIWEAGLIYGNSTENIVSTFVGASPLQTLTTPDTLDYDGSGTQLYATMSDTNKQNSMGLQIEQTVTANNDNGMENTLIFQWKLINNSANTYEDFHSGVYFDWDLVSAGTNKAFFDTENQIAFCKNNIGENMVTGIKIWGEPFHHYAFDLIDDPEGINITDGFTNEERWFALSNERPEAGEGTGNDVAHIVATESITFEPNDTALLTMIIAAGYHETEVITATENAEAYISQLNAISSNKPTEKLSVFPQPAGGYVNLKAQENIRQIEIYSLDGKLMQQKVVNGKTILLITRLLEPGIYILKAFGHEASYAVKLVIASPAP